MLSAITRIVKQSVAARLPTGARSAQRAGRISAGSLTAKAILLYVHARAHASLLRAGSTEVGRCTTRRTGCEIALAASRAREDDIDYRYAGSLQLLDAENDDGDRSLPQIQSPALLGVFRKCSFRDAKYLSIASLASSSEA